MQRAAQRQILALISAFAFSGDGVKKCVTAHLFGLDNLDGCAGACASVHARSLPACMRCVRDCAYALAHTARSARGAAQCSFLLGLFPKVKKQVEKSFP